MTSLSQLKCGCRRCSADLPLHSWRELLIALFCRRRLLRAVLRNCCVIDSNSNPNPQHSARRLQFDSQATSRGTSGVDQFEPIIRVHSPVTFSLDHRRHVTSSWFPAYVLCPDSGWTSNSGSLMRRIRVSRHHDAAGFRCRDVVCESGQHRRRYHRCDVFAVSHCRNVNYSQFTLIQVGRRRKSCWHNFSTSCFEVHFCLASSSHVVAPIGDKFPTFSRTDFAK